MFQEPPQGCVQDMGKNRYILGVKVLLNKKHHKCLISFYISFGNPGSLNEEWRGIDSKYAENLGSFGICCS